MSLSIENLKFTIFASGHDYTMMDSGKGEKQFFSHPFMAKGARAYAGMYYFLVPDEDGNPMDAVLSDIAHCTFTPALGDTFDTVGEVEVKVDYRREYIYDEETVVVEKHLKQIVNVVDHGAVSASYFNNIIYADGYCYVNNGSDYVSRSNGWWLSGSFKKISSLPWGTTSISNISVNLEDASEMGFADFSKMTSFKELFKGKTKLTNIQNFDRIDVSHIRNVQDCFWGCVSLVDITPLKTWRLQNCQNFKGFLGGTGIVNTDGLQNIDFSSAYSTAQFFYSCIYLTDLNGISGWDMSPIEDTSEMFRYDLELTDLTPLKDWNMSNVLDMSNMLGGISYYNAGMSKLRKLDGLEGWNVSKCVNFTGALGGHHWLDDITAISGWDVSRGQYFDGMLGFYCGANLNAISGWDMSNAVSLLNMLGNGDKYWSDKIGKYVVTLATNEYSDYDGNHYMEYDVTPPDLELITQDASAVSGWNVPNGSDAFCENPDHPEYQSWTNIPSWN